MNIKEYKECILPLRDKLYRYAFFLLKNEEDAKDTVQDVLLKIWDERNKRSYDKPEAWAITLTRNRAMDKIRKRQKQYNEVDDLTSLRDQNPGPAQQLSTSQMHQQLLHQVTKLSEKQQRIFHLRELEGKSYQEISEELELDISQVKVYLHRARKFLKEKLFKIESYGLQ
jgi:RNA polymerase sigma-70 factor (ECF subfamily)